jgi:hypothetical protein
VNGQWKLFGISVGLAHTGPAAPAPAPAAAAPAPKAKPDKKPGAKSDRPAHPKEPQP